MDKKNTTVTMSLADFDELKGYQNELAEIKDELAEAIIGEYTKEYKLGITVNQGVIEKMLFKIASQYHALANFGDVMFEWKKSKGDEEVE